MTSPSADDRREKASGPRPYRLSDHERSLAISALSDAFSEGRLDGDEFRERMSAASEAKLASDLDPLFVDLPGRTPTFLHSDAREGRTHGTPRGARGARTHGVVQPARSPRPRPYGRAPVAYPHPVMFMPLIVLVIATTNMWFFLPLLFISLGMMSGPGRTDMRRFHSGCDRRPLRGPQSTDGTS